MVVSGAEKLRLFGDTTRLPAYNDPIGPDGGLCVLRLRPFATRTPRFGGKGDFFTGSLYKGANLSIEGSAEETCVSAPISCRQAAVASAGQSNYSGVEEDSSWLVRSSMGRG